MKPGFRASLAAGQLQVGTWLTLSDPAICEIMAAAGFDFLTVDLEHSALSIDQAAALIRTAELAGSLPLVRLSANDPVQIKRLMDAGAHGIIVPMVTSVAELTDAHAAMHYPPAGTRGVGLARAQAYGQGFHSYRSWLAEHAVLIAQLEHQDVLDRLDQILAFPGLDAYLVGPYDLSASMGLAGQLEHPRFLAAMDRIKDAAARHGVPAGIHIVEPDPAALAERVDQGYTLIAYSVDFRMLAVAAQHGLDRLRGAQVGDA